jgi:N-acetyl-1-D-myo-inositol-2-amino-2-deoxy-alpha-D-glucopyranoside deacetylase
MTPRILFVHAHPDDEAITTGGTIAKYVTEGAHVVVLTCTLGEEGDVIGDEWKRLHRNFSDQLGGFRAWELANSLTELGVDRPRFLGGIGRWRDSGMNSPTPGIHAGTFAGSPIEDIVDSLAFVIRRLRPHVVVSYDRGGGYGHPDHIRAAEVTSLAVLDAAAVDWSGDASTPWVVPKVYATVTESSDLAEGLLGISDTRIGCHVPTHAELYSVPDEDVTTTIDISDHLVAKLNAMRAHKTQLRVQDSAREFVTSNFVLQPISPREHYVLLRGSRGQLAPDGREFDLLSGIDTKE